MNHLDCQTFQLTVQPTLAEAKTAVFFHTKILSRDAQNAINLDRREWLARALLIFVAIGFGVLIFEHKKINFEYPFIWLLVSGTVLFYAILNNQFQQRKAINPIIHRLTTSLAEVTVNEKGLLWIRDQGSIFSPWSMIISLGIENNVLCFVRRDFITLYIPKREMQSDIWSELVKSTHLWQAHFDESDKNLSSVGQICIPNPSDLNQTAGVVRPFLKYSSASLNWTLGQKISYLASFILGCFLCASPFWYVKFFNHF